MGIIVCKNERITETSKQLDKQLRKERVEQNTRIKTLLLGNADSGKSTIAKQMRLTYLDGFNDTERRNAIFEIRGSILEAFHLISVQIINQDNIVADEKEEDLIQLFATNVSKIELMQETDELSVLNTFNFSIHLLRILASDFIPNDNDMLHMRTADSGVYEICFEVDEKMIRLIDIGGQRSEHKKWTHFFDSIKCVFFILALNSYDKQVEDDRRAVSLQSEVSQMKLIRARSINRNSFTELLFKSILKDSIELFYQIRENQFLNEASIVIFLNKMDLFEMKIKNICFNEFIPEYRNENTVERIVEYIKTEMTKDASNNRQVYVHSTTATETDSIKKAFSQEIERVINKQIEDEAQNGY